MATFALETGPGKPTGQPSPKRKKQILISASSPAIQSRTMIDSSTEDPINARITNLENRLNSCDSIYRLNVQAQTLREKEKREKLAGLAGGIEEMQRRMRTIEASMSNVEKLVRQIVQEEVARMKPGQSGSSVAIAGEIEMEEKTRRLRALMKQGAKGRLEQYNALSQRVDEIRDPRIAEIRERIERLKRNQEAISRTVL